MNERDWKDTRAAIDGALQVVGAVAVAVVLLEQGDILASKGLRGWLNEGISGADFVLLLVIVPAVLWVALTAALERLSRR